MSEFLQPSPIAYKVFLQGHGRPFLYNTYANGRIASAVLQLAKEAGFRGYVEAERLYNYSLPNHTASLTPPGVGLPR